jgi:hypothetical protein
MPTFPAIIKKITYRVGTKRGEVTITAKVGSAQRGEPVAILDEDTELPEEPLPGSAVLFKAGKAQKLVGHTVRVQTFVSDVNPKTDLTVVNYEIDGGIQMIADNTQGEVESAGGRIGHFFFIDFQS